MLGVVDWDRSLHIRPLSDEISECLLYDRVTGPKIDGIGAELNRPFDDVVVSFFVAENITKGEFGDYDDVVILKIMVKLVGCDLD